MAKPPSAKPPVPSAARHGVAEAAQPPVPSAARHGVAEAAQAAEAAGVWDTIIEIYKQHNPAQLLRITELKENTNLCLSS